MHWFWILYGSGLALVIVLFWISEISNMSLGGKKKKSKSIWQKSKDRIHTQNYNTSTHYSAGNTHYIRRKGM